MALKNVTQLGVADGLFETMDIMSQTSNGKRNESEGEQVQYIDPSLLDEDPNNEIIYNMDDIETLARNIKESGEIEEPIRAYKRPHSNHYLIQSGHRRKRAALIANMKKVPVIVLPWEPDENIRIRNLINGNIHNRKDQPMTIARQMIWLAKTYPEKTKTEIIDMLHGITGYHEAQIRRYLALNDFIKELQDKANKPEVFSLVGLSEARNMTEQQQMQYNDMIDRFIAQRGESAISKTVLIKLAKEVKQGNPYQTEKRKVQFSVKSFRTSTTNYLNNFTTMPSNISDEEREDMLVILNEAKSEIEKYIQSIS